MNPQDVLGQIIVFVGKVITFATGKKFGFTHEFWGRLLTINGTVKSLTLFKMSNSVEEYLVTLEMKSVTFGMLFSKSGNLV